VVPIVNCHDEAKCVQAGEVLFRAQTISDSDEQLPRIEKMEVLHVVNREADITDDMIKVGDNVPSEVKENLRQLLNEYRDIFALSINELGRTKLVTMTIEEQSGSNPVSQSPYIAHPDLKEKSYRKLLIVLRVRV
jgi:hypothetical protein